VAESAFLTMPEPASEQQRADQRRPAGDPAWLDRRIGRPWSVRSLRACLGTALVTCWVAYFLGWGLGGSGQVGDVRLLADAPQPARLASALSAIAVPLLAMLLGRTLGRLERRAKLRLVRWRRRKPTQYRTRVRLKDFERGYRWLLGMLFGAALIATLVWFRRGDVAAFAILFSWLALGPVSGIAAARRFSGPAAQGAAALAAGVGSITGAVLLILAFAGAGVAAFAFAILGVTNVAFAGAIGVLLDILMGGMVTIGLALAGAGVATVALALAGAGTGIATLTGVATMARAGLAASVLLMAGASVATLAFEDAAVLSAAIGGISALAVAAAVAHGRRGRHGAHAGALGAIALLTIAAVLLGWGQRPLVIFAVCFFLMLPLLVGLNGWIALAAMRSLLAWTARARRRRWPLLPAMAACWLIGALFVAALAFLLGAGAEGYNQVTLVRSGLPAFEIQPMIEKAAAAPFQEGLWLTLLLLTPIFPPALLTAKLMSDGLLRLQPHDYRLRRPAFRLLGSVLTAAIVVGVVALVDASAQLEPAILLGDLALAGLDASRGAFGPPAP
jgi:hypothetical protein